MEKNKRVVITGMGVLSSIGTNVSEHAESLKNNISGIKSIERFDTSHKIFRNHSACVIDNKQLSIITENDDTLLTSCGIYSIKEAITDANLNVSDLKDAALVIGTSIGASHTFSKFYKDYCDTGVVTEIMSEMASNSAQTITGEIADYFGIKGPNCTISTACSAGTNAVGRGMDMIRAGNVSKAVVGGIDIFTELAFSGFNCLQALSKTKCMPFSKNRDGLMLGDASAFLILEDMDSALKEDKHIYAEVLSYHFFDEAFHPTSLKSDGSSVFECMKKTLEKVNISINDIDYINAHGTGTKVNDPSELKGVELLLAERKVKNPVYMSSIKGMIGHCLGAAGAVELISTIIGMNKGFVPANMNVEKQDVLDFTENIIIPNKSVRSDIRYAISNSFAFGGNMSSILINKYNN